MRIIFAALLMLGCTALSSTTTLTAVAQEIAGVKCVVDGDRNAQEQFKVDHAGGEVYFCCQGCAASFVADRERFLTRANHQLVVTQQYSQSSCPIAGKAFDLQQMVKIGGVEVAFCCPQCKLKIESATDLQAKAELVFAAQPFKRSFVKVDPDDSQTTTAVVDLSKVKCVVDPARKAVETFAADYRAGKVYFCCRGCLESFQADPDDFATQANFQLAVSQQYVQKTCPLTGGEVDSPAATIEIAGQSVALCCQKCQRDLAASTDAEKLKAIFSNDGFEKSFVKMDVQQDQHDSVAPAELADPKKRP